MTLKYDCPVQDIYWTAVFTLQKRITKFSKKGWLSDEKGNQFDAFRDAACDSCIHISVGKPGNGYVCLYKERKGPEGPLLYEHKG